MKKEKNEKLSIIDYFNLFAKSIAKFTGRPWAFLAALFLIIGWALTGPIFNYSDKWQLVINSTTTIITFLMVFLIQNTQYRDSASIELKLDEILFKLTSSNDFIKIEEGTEEEIEKCIAHFMKLKEENLKKKKKGK